MAKHTVASSAVLLSCFLASSSPLAAGRGASHGVGRFQGNKMNATGMQQPTDGGDTDRFEDGRSLGLNRAGRAFRSAVGSVTSLVRRPPGWDRGRKTGWEGDTMPPGLAKKPASRFGLLRHGPLARRGTGGIFANGEATRLQAANFDRFLDLNPGLEKSLAQNPSLINNQAFLAAHPSLLAWLKAHPQTAEEIGESPRAFMNFDRRFEARETTRVRLSPVDEDSSDHRFEAKQRHESSEASRDR